jgi:hypothetical protein
MQEVGGSIPPGSTNLPKEILGLVWKAGFLMQALNWCNDLVATKHLAAGNVVQRHASLHYSNSRFENGRVP